MKTLIVFLLLASAAYAAQSITIPEGKTEYGPIAVSKFTRGQMALTPQKCTDRNITGSVTIVASTDGGNTFLSDWMRGFTFRCDSQPIIARDFGLPNGATHIKATVIMTGGSMTLTKTPTMGGK